MTSFVPDASHASTILLARAMPMAMGFSQIMPLIDGYPAASTVMGSCNRCHVHTLTMSGCATLAHSCRVANDCGISQSCMYMVRADSKGSTHAMTSTASTFE